MAAKVLTVTVQVRHCLALFIDHLPSYYALPYASNYTTSRLHIKDNHTPKSKRLWGGDGLMGSIYGAACKWSEFCWERFWQKSPDSITGWLCHRGYLGE
ncbi:hypothetical protein LguiB_013629 [Lonicera macranthoides]